MKTVITNIETTGDCYKVVHIDRIAGLDDIQVSIGYPDTRPERIINTNKFIECDYTGCYVRARANVDGKWLDWSSPIYLTDVTSFGPKDAKHNVDLMSNRRNMSFNGLDVVIRTPPPKEQEAHVVDSFTIGKVAELIELQMVENRSKNRATDNVQLTSILNQIYNLK